MVRYSLEVRLIIIFNIHARHNLTIYQYNESHSHTFNISSGTTERHHNKTHEAYDSSRLVDSIIAMQRSLCILD